MLWTVSGRRGGEGASVYWYAATLKHGWTHKPKYAIHELGANGVLRRCAWHDGDVATVRVGSSAAPGVRSDFYICCSMLVHSEEKRVKYYCFCRKIYLVSLFIL